MPQLTDSLSIKNIHVRNRIVIPPMVSGLAVQGEPRMRLLVSLQ
jgi:2,4-dienoyl-CoA reductase-like NADH-dependent reductase (Old Yellow Enzyme family)